MSKFSTPKRQQRWGALLAATLLMASSTSPTCSAAEIGAKPINATGFSTLRHDATSGLSEYRLKSNGLTVLLKEMHGAPVVTVMMLYKVGSRNEGVGYTGATHFLEHMMFRGSSGFDPQKHSGIDDVLKPIGGQNNATTWFDRTSYFEVVPAGNLSLCLQFESDRMRHLLLRGDDRKSEMTVVRNELERNENEASAILDTQLFATAFREHPYHHPTIGWRSDVEGVPLSRLKKFYDDFYWPNNATLMVIGDFKTPNALRLIADNFAKIPRSPAPIPTVYTTEPPQEGERRFTVQRGEDLPKVMLGYHVPKALSPDSYTLDVIESLLGDDNHQSSRLYKRLVDSSMASDTYANSYCLRDPGLFVVYASATPATDLANLESSIQSELDKLKTEPVPEAELNRAKTSISKRLRLSSVDPLELAQQVGEALAVGDLNYWLHYNDKIKAVTQDDIKRVAAKYFTVKNRTVGDYLPASNAIQQAEGSQSPASGVVNYRATGNQPKDGRRLTSTVTRSTTGVQPTLSIAPRVKRKVLSNGLTVLVLPQPGAPAISIAGSIKSGEYFAADGQTLVPNLLADMLSKGSANFSQEAIAQELENMGTSFNPNAGHFWLNFQTDVVKEDMDRFLLLVSDILTRPQFPAAELDKSKKVWEAKIKQSMADTRAVAMNSLLNSLYKPGDVYYEPGFPQQLQELSGITASDLHNFHRNHFRPKNAVLSVVGDVNPEQVFATMDKYLSHWTGGPAETITAPKAIQLNQSREIKVPLSGKESVDICIGHPVDMSITHPDFFAAAIANAALGHSTFGSRLATLREDYGLTYGISSSFSDVSLGGAPWLIACTVNPQNVQKSLTLIQKITGQYVKDGIKAQELADESKHLAGEFLVDLRMPSEIARFLCRYEMLGVGPSFIDRYASRLQSVTAAQVNQAIRKYLPLNDSLTVLSGSFKEK
jgi:zinc protease